MIKNGMRVFEGTKFGIIYASQKGVTGVERSRRKLRK
jgi:hypothetical protein